MRVEDQIATVATVIEKRERPRLDAAADGRFAAVHVDCVRDALRAVRERPVRLILVSPDCIRRDDLPGVAELVRGFPGIPTVAVVSRHDAESSERLLQLGAHGVRSLFDLSGREGWRRLRDHVAQPTSPAGASILTRVLPALGETTRDCRQYFEILVRLAPSTTTVRALTRWIGVRPSTFMSRFFRAGLPSPKRYLAAMRLVYAAGLLESPGLSIADVAYQLEYSSPQSFGRHLRAAMGLTAGEFRRRFRFRTALDDFVARFVLPFRPALRTFHPLQNGVERFGHGVWRGRKGQALSSEAEGRGRLSES
jgi:AraC-like DNA-binding protein